MYKITVNRFFDAAHQLPDSDNLVTKGCARLHGHTYLVKVEARGKNKRNGMVLDFKAIKQIVDILDHRFINDIFKEYDFSDMDGQTFPSTAENVAKFIYDLIEAEYPDLSEKKVCVIEGFKGQENSSWIEYQK